MGYSLKIQFFLLGACFLLGVSVQAQGKGRGGSHAHSAPVHHAGPVYHPPVYHPPVSHYTPPVRPPVRPPYVPPRFPPVTPPHYPVHPPAHVHYPVHYSHYQSVYENHYSFFYSHYGIYRNYSVNTWYSKYFRFGFYGGYYYPVLPCYRIHTYFHYPLVFWLYVDYYDTDFYQNWYGPDYRTYPIQAFRFAGSYFPTDTLRDLLLEINALNAQRHFAFRTAMLEFTEGLRRQIGEKLRQAFRFQPYEIVVTQYENLKNQAIVLNGFVDRGNEHIAFRGILDLVNPSRSTVFTSTGQKPTDVELSALQALNENIRRSGGTVPTAER